MYIIWPVKNFLSSLEGLRPALDILHKYSVSLVLKHFPTLTFKNVLKLKYLSLCTQRESKGQCLSLYSPDQLFIHLSTKLSQNGIGIL